MINIHYSSLVESLALLWIQPINHYRHGLLRDQLKFNMPLTLIIGQTISRYD